MKRQEKLLIALTGWIILSELASVVAAGGYGSFLWVTLHFILNPVLALVFVVTNTFTIFWKRTKATQYWKVLYAIPAIAFIYISVSGNIILVQNDSVHRKRNTLDVLGSHTESHQV